MRPPGRHHRAAAAAADAAAAQSGPRLLRQRHGAAVPGGAAARARHLAVRVGERAAAGGARGRGGRDRQSRRNSLGSGDG